MKKFLTTAFICLCVCSMAMGFAACGNSNSDSTGRKAGLQFKTYQGEKYITGYVAETDVTTLTIGSDLGKVKIQANAFSNNASIEKLVIGSNVEEIGAGAFAKMKSLKEIEVPYVGSSANAVNEKKTFGYVFGTESYDEGLAVTQSYNASATATYYLPETLVKVTVTAAEDYALPAYAFNNIGRLSTITLSGNVTAIGAHAFDGCYGISAFTVPDTVTEIGEGAFLGCTRLSGTAGTTAADAFRFSAQSNLTKIGNSAFAGTRMTEITLPEGVTEIGEYSFASVLNGVTVTAESMLEKITLPNSLKVIAQYAFIKSVNLEQVIYSDSLEKIGIGAFQYCDSLKLFKNKSATQTLPAADNEGILVFVSSITKISAAAFADVGAELIEYDTVGLMDNVCEDTWNNNTLFK